MSNYFKKTLAVIFSALIIFPSLVKAYDDVPYDSEYFYGIEYLRRNDVFQNTKLFKPNILITRAEFIKYLVLLNSQKFIPAKNIKLPYSDTKNNAWYAPYIYEAIDLGILDGKEKTISPEKQITVVEALTLLFHSKSVPIPNKYVGTIPYKDVEKRNDRGMIMRAMYLGVVKPEKNTYFGVLSRLTRAKAAYMIYKMDLVDLRDPQNTDESTDPYLKKIIDSWKIITSGYVDRDAVDSIALSDAAVKAMADSLNDPYTVYMDTQQNQIFSDELGGQFEGIGAYISQEKDGTTKIISPIKDSPADKAGVKAGDIIKKVDDFSADGAKLTDIITHIKGPKGSTLKLTLLRNGSTLILEVKRDVINVKSVENEIVDGGDIMHIKIASFSETAASEFKDVSEMIQVNKNIKGIIIDMRDDPGGFLDAAVRILDLLLPKNTLVVKIQYNNTVLLQKTSSDGPLKEYPMIVLLNGGSASASEIVAGALQDNGKAKIVGEKSFGKGTVQELNYFADNSSLKITIAKWLTPNGNSIDKNGIKPDIEVLAGNEKGSDPQLDRAITELKKLLK